jgi:predicted phosphodiesterase
MTNLARIGALAILVLGYLPTAAVEPPRQPEHEFTFVVLGDSQFHLPNTFNRIIDEIVFLYPSFVIQVGDMIGGYVDDLDEFRAQWKRFRAQIAPLGEIPFYPVPGNHDLLDASRKPAGEKIYQDVWGELYYSFDYHNSHVVVLNTDEGEGSKIVGEQLRWLERDLDKARSQEHIFVFFHRPIYSLQNQEELHKLFLDHEVSAVVYGHMHHLNYHERDGIPYIMTTSATRLSTPFPQEAGSFHHMLLVTVRDTAFRIAVIKAGSVLPPDIVSPEDNSRLFNLEKRFLSEKSVEFRQLKQTDRTYEVVLHVNNPTNQDLLTFFEWQLPNARWAVDPSKGRRVVLPAGTRDHPVSFSIRRKFPDPPEAFPSCIVKALYLTDGGDVVQSEHVFEIVADTEEE